MRIVASVMVERVYVEKIYEVFCWCDWVLEVSLTVWPRIRKCRLYEEFWKSGFIIDRCLLAIDKTVTPYSQYLQSILTVLVIYIV